MRMPLAGGLLLIAQLAAAQPRDPHAVQPERRPELAAEMREVLDALAAVQGASSAAIQSVAALVTDLAGTS